MYCIWNLLLQICCLHLRSLPPTQQKQKQGTRFEGQEVYERCCWVVLALSLSDNDRAHLGLGSATTKLDGGSVATQPCEGKQGWLLAEASVPGSTLNGFCQSREPRGGRQAASVTEDRGSGVTHHPLPHSALWSCVVKQQPGKGD